MTSEKQVRLKELKRCFQFLCEKFNWTIRFIETSTDVNNNLFPLNPQIKMLEDIYLSDVISYHEIRLSLISYKFDIDSKTNTISGEQAYEVTAPRISKKLLLSAKEPEHFLDKTYYIGDTIKLTKEFSKSEVILECFEDLKRKLCDPSRMILTRKICTGCVEYLSGPLPEFESLEELKLKLAMKDVTKIEMETEYEKRYGRF